MNYQLFLKTKKNISLMMWKPSMIVENMRLLFYKLNPQTKLKLLFFLLLLEENGVEILKKQ